jgi:colanic acid biosynthesis glycosyl transferase WcaI
MGHDLQEVYSIDKRGVKNKIIRFFKHKIERKCCQSCNKLVFLSGEMKE